MVATGVTITGDREVLGLAVGDSEDGAFWTEFLRSLRARGLADVRLVISDAHLGIRAAIDTVMLGSAWLTRIDNDELHPTGGILDPRASSADRAIGLLELSDRSPDEYGSPEPLAAKHWYAREAAGRHLCRCTFA